jgi:asparagine synthase (glutamine-hydrolysing)
VAARQLLAKCRRLAARGQFSNADNMAVVGILSTQLVHDQFIRRRPQGGPGVAVRTLVDRVAEPPPVVSSR